jgi:adenine-specific DNA-methyltransferase
MESYFCEHMAERDLLFHHTVAPLLAVYTPEASATQQRDYHTQFYMMLNTPNHLVRNRLTTDSPDHFGICNQEGII